MVRVGNGGVKRLEFFFDFLILEENSLALKANFPGFWALLAG